MGSLQGDGPSYCPLLPTSHQWALKHAPDNGAGSQHSLPTWDSVSSLHGTGFLPIGIGPLLTGDKTAPRMGQCPLLTWDHVPSSLTQHSQHLVNFRQ